MKKRKGKRKTKVKKRGKEGKEKRYDDLGRKKKGRKAEIDNEKIIMRKKWKRKGKYVERKKWM